MHKIIALGLSTLLFTASGAVFAQEEAQPEEQSEEIFTAEDAAEVRTEYAALDKELKEIHTDLKKISTFKGKKKAKELKTFVGDLKKKITNAQTICGNLSKKAKGMEWSKVPKIAERISGELETLSSIIDSIDNPDAITTSLKNEFKQSQRSLKKDFKKLGNAKPIAS